jgi:hypothetical protein
VKLRLASQAASASSGALESSNQEKFQCPGYPLGNMLKVAFMVCVALALIRRERFADADLNTWVKHWHIFYRALP